MMAHMSKGVYVKNVRLEFCANVVQYTLHDEGDGEGLIRWVAEKMVLNAKRCAYDDERVPPATEIVALGLHGVCAR